MHGGPVPSSHHTSPSDLTSFSNISHEQRFAGSLVASDYGSEFSDDTESCRVPEPRQRQLLGIRLPPPPSDTSSYATYEYVLRKRPDKRRFNPYQRPVSAKPTSRSSRSESTDDDELVKTPESARSIVVEPEVVAQDTSTSPSHPASAVSPVSPSSPNFLRLRKSKTPPANAPDTLNKVRTSSRARTNSAASTPRITKAKSKSSSSSCGSIPSRPAQHKREAMSCCQGLVTHARRLHRTADLANLRHYNARPVRRPHSLHAIWHDCSADRATTEFVASASAHGAAKPDAAGSSQDAETDRGAEMATMAWGADWGHRLPCAFSEDSDDVVVKIDPEETHVRPVGFLYGADPGANGHALVFGGASVDDWTPEHVGAVERWMEQQPDAMGGMEDQWGRPLRDKWYATCEMAVPSVGHVDVVEDVEQEMWKSLNTVMY